jgi:hypothetical protein
MRSIGEAIKNDGGNAFCDRIDKFLRHRQFELAASAVHDSMMPLLEAEGNGACLFHRFACSDEEVFPAASKPGRVHAVII